MNCQQRIAFFSTESGESDTNSRENSIAASSFSEFETITSTISDKIGGPIGRKR